MILEKIIQKKFEQKETAPTHQNEKFTNFKKIIDEVDDIESRTYK